MADDVTTQEISSPSGNPPPPGSGTNFLNVPGEARLAGHEVRINRLLINSQQFIPRHNIPLQGGEEVTLEGRGLDFYDRVGLTLTDGGGSFTIVLKSSASGDGFFSFKLPDVDGQVKDGGQFWLKLLSRAFPAANATLEPRAIYFFEQSEDKKDGKATDKENRGRAQAARSSQGGPVDLVMGAMAGTLGGITGALKSTTDASSVGTKTLSQSGTVNVTNTKEVSSGGTVNEGGDYDEEIQQEVQGTGEGGVTSTSEISTGGQTISQGSTGVAQTVSAGGTVESAGSAGVSGQITSTVSGSVAGGGASESVSVQREVLSTVQGGGGITGGGASSGTANVSGRAVSSGQTNAGATVTGQSATTGTQGASAKGTGEVKDSVKENIETKTEVKTEVQVSGAPASGGSTQIQTPTVAAAPPTSTSSQGTVASTATGTAGSGAGSPTFNSRTRPGVPAGLGNMLKNDAALNLSRNLNISTGGTAMPSAAGKPSQGGASTPGVLDGKKETADAGGGEAAKNLDQTNASGLLASPETGEGGKQQEPGVGGKSDDKEAKPPSEANPISANRPKPEDDTKNKVPPPLGQTVGLHGQRPEGQQAGQPGRPIDSANGQKSPSGENNLGFGDSQMGEPLSQAPETGEGTPSGSLSAGDTGGPSGSGPSAGQTVGDEAATGATEGAEAGAGFDPEGAMVGAALGALANTKAGQKILDKVGGQASSKIWYYGFGSSAATFFTGLDFMLGAVVMDSYWLFGHRKNPELFPLKGWQKIVTIAANVVPPILITLAIALIMVAGCNWPTPVKTSIGNSYRFTVIGAFIGDSCKYFDVSNITSSGNSSPFGGGSAGGAGASGNLNASPTAADPVTPKGPSPATGTTPPINPVASVAGILSFIKSWNGPEVYPTIDWGNLDPNIDPTIKANLNELQNNFNNLNSAWQKAGRAALAPKQVYRPQAYQEHYRSIWEIFAVINNVDNTQGYLCSQTSHLDKATVKQAYAQATAADKQTLQSLYIAHEISLTSTPAGCVSDHASGIAMDIADQAIDGFNTSLYPTLKSTAQNYGLCHNISGDIPHFALTNKLPSGTNCSQP
jgi:hypothetical protein